MWTNSRRDFLKLGCALLPLWKGFPVLNEDSGPATVNDIHSQLNATRACWPDELAQASFADGRDRA